MNVRTLGISLGILAAASAVALPASAQKPQKQPKPVPGDVSIGAQPAAVVAGSPVTLTGKVKNAAATTTVTLMRRTLPATTFKGASTVTVDKQGNYSFVLRPRRNTYYRAVSSLQPATQSSDLLVKVSPLVGFRVSDSTPRAGQRVRFSGIVRPAHNGRSASIQRRSGDRWITIARPTLRSLDASTSRYSRTLRVRSSGVYRVRVIGHADHAMGVSRERTLVAH